MKEYEKAVRKYDTRTEAGKNKNNQGTGKKEVRDEKRKTK
jgi:hypothetical protein